MNEKEKVLRKMPIDRLKEIAALGLESFIFYGEHGDDESFETAEKDLILILDEIKRRLL